MRVISVKTTIDKAKIGEIASQAVSSGIIAAADYMAGQIRKSMSNRNGPSAPGTPPAFGTGYLSRSIARTDPRAGVVYIHTSQVRYARIQEKGGTIRPVAKQYLAIPISVQAKRLSARTSTAGSGTLLNSAVPMVVRRSKAGNLILFATAKWGKGKHAIRMGEPMFVLKKSVTLKPRPYMAPAARNSDWISTATKLFARRSREVINRGVR